MKRRELRVLLEPGTGGAENMRRDAALLEACGAETPPTLRLYTWDRPTISVGWMQDPAALLDLSACRGAGVDVVRRPTGGRAILHAGEITYAMIAPLADERFGSSVGESHAVIGTCLADGLAHLGLHTEGSRPKRDPRRSTLRQPCFTSSGRNELLVQGRKLVGSAQRRSQRAFLQHGSLLIDRGHERLIDFLLDARQDVHAAAALRHTLQRRTTTLRDELGRTPTFDELAPVLTHAFASRLGLAATQLASPI